MKAVDEGKTHKLLGAGSVLDFEPLWVVTDGWQDAVETAGHYGASLTSTL